MAGGTNQQLGQQLEAFQIDTPGARIKAEDFLKMSAVAALARFMMLALYDEGVEEPPGCVLGEYGGLGDHLLAANGVGDLDWTIEPGVAFVFDSSEVATSSPHVSNAYLPAVLVAQASGTLSAHDSQPRIDVAYITPVATDDTGEPRAARSLVNGTLTAPNPTVNTRHQLTGTISIAEGTPGASPAAPSVPAGSLKLAEFLVPATSGTITVTDFRQFATIGESFRGPPPNSFYEPHVLSTSPSPAILTSNPAVVLDACYVATVAGMRRVPQTTLLTSDAAASNSRIDLITVDESGAYVITEGAETTGTPVTPLAPANHIPMFSYEIDENGAKTNVTTLYDNYSAPYGINQLLPGSVDTAQLVDDAVTNAKVAPNAVDTAQIVDDAVTPDKLSAVSVSRFVAAVGFQPANNPRIEVNGDDGIWNLAQVNQVYFFEYAVELPPGCTFERVYTYFSSVDNNVNQYRTEVIKRPVAVSGASTGLYDSTFTNISSSGEVDTSDALAEFVDPDDEHWYVVRVSVDMDAAATPLGTAFRGVRIDFTTPGGPSS